MSISSSFHVVDRLKTDAVGERERVVRKLRATPASVEPKFFYDELGCALYGAICQLDEYYPTRTERAIFQAFRSEIATAINAGRGDAARATFIDLGAGDCCKAQSWLPFLQVGRYLAVDIAAHEITLALGKMAAEFPDVEMAGLATDFSQQLQIPEELMIGPRVVFYPGSSIGNFSPAEAVRFLTDIRAVLGQSGGGLLIGVDAKKAQATLDAAYADALGVTAAFNLNVLRHLNRMLGTNFDCADWQHAGFYNAAAGRVEMHLQAKRDVVVAIDGQPRVFKLGQRIHTESSYKYDRPEFEALLNQAGFVNIQCWTNAASAFWVFYAT